MSHLELSLWFSLQNSLMWSCPGQPVNVKYHLLQQLSLLPICLIPISLFKPGINQGLLLLCNPIKRELNISQKLDPSA